MDRPPFRFAVQATNAAGGREWHDTVRKVEDLGYSTLFLADNYLEPGHGPAGLATSIGIAAELLRGHPNVLVGSVESVVETLCSRREELGINYATVQQSQIESFAPVGDRLHGR